MSKRSIKRVFCVLSLSALIFVGLSQHALAARSDEFGLTDVLFGVPNANPALLGYFDEGFVPGGTPAQVTDALNSLGIVKTIAELETPLNLDAYNLGQVAYGRCLLSSDWPHHSSTQPGYIHAKGKAKCTVFMPHLYESGILWKQRWYGWQDTGYANATGSGYSNQVINKHYCKSTTYTYVVQNYHYGRWPTGGEYKRMTAAKNRVTC